jgi:hypothetical protein
MKNLFTYFLLCLAFPLFAQQASDTLINLSQPVTSRLLEVSVSANSYSGDLSRYESLSSFFHVALRFNQERRINHRLGVASGFITGNNRFYQFRDTEGNLTTPNTFFRTQVLSFTYELEYNLIYRRNFRLYLSQGIGLSRFTAENEDNKNLLDLSQTRPFEEIYGNFTIHLPTGLGAIYLFKNGFGVGGYAGFVNTQTDFLDNISAWGNKSGNDNILRFRFSFLIPLERSEVLKFPDARRFEYYPYENE